MVLISDESLNLIDEIFAHLAYHGKLTFGEGIEFRDRVDALRKKKSILGAILARDELIPLLMGIHPDLDELIGIKIKGDEDGKAFELGRDQNRVCSLS